MQKILIPLLLLCLPAWVHASGRLQTPAAHGIRMVMQVHDELVFEVAEERLDLARTEVSARMSAAADLRVPLLVDVGVGDNWDQAHLGGGPAGAPVRSLLSVIGSGIIFGGMGCIRLLRRGFLRSCWAARVRSNWN